MLTSFTVAATSFSFAVSTPDRDLMDDAMFLMPLPAFLRSSPTPEKPRITSRICFNFSVSNPSVIFFIEVRAFVTLSIPPSALSVVASISNKMLSTLLSGILPPHFVETLSVGGIVLSEYKKTWGTAPDLRRFGSSTYPHVISYFSLRCLNRLLCSAAKAANLSASVIFAPGGVLSVLFMLLGWLGYAGEFLSRNIAMASTTYEPTDHANVSIAVACSFASISLFFWNGSNFLGFSFQKVS